MEQETKILLGVTAVGAVIAGYFWWKKSQNAGAAHPLSNLAVSPQSPQSAGSGSLGSPGRGVPLAAVSPFAPPVTATRFTPNMVMAMPSALGGGSQAAPTQTPLSQDGNYVQTAKGLFTWAQGGSYDASTGLISNLTSAQLAITTPSGPLTLSPNMTYNVNTGEVGF